jgi:hypothetical protein
VPVGEEGYWYETKPVCLALALIGAEPGVWLVRDLHAKDKISGDDWKEIGEVFGARAGEE